MADKKAAPVQHTPKHLEGDVIDKRHPAASAFAPLQPAAGVVANDVVERGQNLAGGQKADDAEAANKDQPEKLAAQYEESLRVGAGVSTAAAANVEGDKATAVKSDAPAPKSDATKK